MSVGSSNALVSQNQLGQEQVQIQQQQVTPPPLARLMAIAETSVVGVFDQIALLSARLEAAERQNREMAAMYGAQLSANAQAIATLSDQVKVLGTLELELAKSRQENAQLKQANTGMRENWRAINHQRKEIERIIQSSSLDMDLLDPYLAPNYQELRRLTAESPQIFAECPQTSKERVCP